MWKDTVFKAWKIPVQSIRDIYGENIAFYYSWLSFYIAWLLPGGVFGLIFYYLRKDGITVDNSPFIPFFTLLMILYSFYFLKGWKRKSTELAFSWNSLHYENPRNIRASFVGYWQQSPITDEMELYYPDLYRRFFYLLSTIVTVVMLFIALFVMICSLNLQGFVSCKSRFHNENPFHIPFLHQFSENGNIFDPNTHEYLAYVPVILHTLVIMILNKIYSKIAIILTNLENHRTDEDYENALIVKRFLFEAFDCYISLFYLAFYELDIIRLRSELMMLFCSDCARRVAVETVIPLFLHTFKSRSINKQYRTSGEREASNESLIDLLKEVEKEPIESFDDYLEMVIQYGYITLFTSAFPFASVIAFVTNIIELKSDSFKLIFLHKRPQVHRVNSIGTWFTVLTIQTWIAIITNIFLIGFTSGQLLQWVPDFYEKIVLFADDGVTSFIEQQIKLGSGRFVLAIIFIIEHILFIIGLLITFFISDVPEAVRIAIARRAYFKNKELDQLRDNLSSVCLSSTKEKAQ